MFVAQTARIAALGNRVPTAILVLEVVGAALALGLLAAYPALVGRGVLAFTLAAGSSRSCCSSPPAATAPRSASP